MTSLFLGKSPFYFKKERFKKTAKSSVIVMTYKPLIPQLHSYNKTN